jgi:DNA-3-methyladenine glycosylase II
MIDYSTAVAHLRRADPVLAKIIAQYGPCSLKLDRRYFRLLIEAILSQQLSTKAAATITARFYDRLQGQVGPAAILALHDHDFRGTGVSRQKTLYLRDLAAKWQAGAINPRRFVRLADEEIIMTLTQVKGIGRWTAEMFLMFALGRPDVLPVADLGFRNALKKAYRLRKLPDSKRVHLLAEKWRPYRSVATWYFWASLDNKPISENE